MEWIRPKTRLNAASPSPPFLRRCIAAPRPGQNHQEYNAWPKLKMEIQGPDKCVEGNEAASKLRVGAAFTDDCAAFWGARQPLEPQPSSLRTRAASILVIPRSPTRRRQSDGPSRYASARE
jgi:hypothetical protein